MSERVRFMWFGGIAGFCVVIAFGVGLISMAVFDSGRESSAVAGTQAAADAQTIEVTLGDLFIKPAKLTAAAGTARFEVTNDGQTEHNFAIEGMGGTEMIPAGESATLDVSDLEAGSYTFVCEVAGHAGGGMKGTLTVGDGAGGSGMDHSGMSGMSAQQMAMHDAEVTGSFPAKTKGIGGTVLEPDIVDGVKVFELTADEVKWEVSPGDVKEAWAYNGMVPGPQLKLELGDRVRIVLHNKLAEPTTIHFHGMTVPANMDGVPAISQDAVLPGDSFTYEFTIRNTGSNMYHSHFNAQKQVPMGLLGTMIVADPKDPSVDQDVTMVLNDGPLGFTLNGKGFPGTAPIVVDEGDTFRIRYMNEGLQIHPMHLHGVPQKVIAKDGHYLPDPHWEDTVLVAPGERVDVLVKATEPGTWAFHCHILTHAESEDGMFGMVTAVVVQ
ncbi:MAG TPA: multicopper oxidase domain-containing protein [Actinomycetota bacterium]|nr:multicopper oxidase domain-containing protein [Actinomycetota bacterium]